MTRNAFALGLGFIFTLTLGCSEDDHISRPPTADEIPTSVLVSGGPMTAGFARGPLRVAKTVPTFRITKSPITVAEYKQCIAAGACSSPTVKESTCNQAFAPTSTSANRTIEGRTFEVDDHLPITCLAPEQAHAYCAWQGGKLPTANEWLFAARGAAPSRYAWGNEAPTCDQHPGGHLVDAQSSCASAVHDFATGTHTKGASLKGIEDVLLSRAELLRTDGDAQFGACTIGDFCLIQGMSPGEIDGLRGVIAKDRTLPTFGFRCVSGEVTQ